MSHHILLVEDERIVALEERAALEHAGYRVTPVTTGEDGVRQALGNNSIDLVLMDINLGEGINGVEAARRILGERDLPIVFCTSHTDRETVEQVGEIIHYGYVVKTTGPHVLIETVSTAYQLAAARRGQVAVERMLEEQRRRYEALYYSSFLTVVIYDREARIVSGNRTPTAGTNPEELIGKSLREIAPQMYEATLSRIQRCLLSGETEECIDRMQVDDRDIWFQSRFEPIPGVDGKEDLVMVISDDITDAYAHGLDFAKQSELVNAITEHAPVYIYVYDADEQRNLWVNNAYRELLAELSEDGTPDVTASRSSIFSYLHPDDQKALLEREKIWMSDPSPPPDLPLRFKAGDSWRWVLNRSAPLVRRPDGTAQRIIGFLIDIADLKQTQVELEETIRTNHLLAVEMNHRVKNNLHLARSLINIKAMESGVDLSDLENRVAAIGLAHESLFSAGGGDTIALAHYLERVAAAVFHAAGCDDVSVTVAVPDTQVSAREAVALGLIVNEAATNAAKHAFDAGHHQFVVSDATGEHHYALTIRNSGKPFPDSVAFEGSESLGLTLIQMLAQQIGGSAHLSRTPETTLEIRFERTPSWITLEGK